MFKLHRILLAGALLAMASTTSMAGTLAAGGLSGSANAVPVNPSPNLAPDVTLTPGFVVDGGGSGSLAGFHAVNDVAVNLGDLSGFTMTFDDGSGNTLSFTATNVSSYETLPASSPYTFVGIVMTGNVDFNGDTNTALVSLSFTQSHFAGQNGPIGSSISLVIPAFAIPEPSSIVLSGIGLAAAGLFGLRKRRAK